MPASQPNPQEAPPKGMSNLQRLRYAILNLRGWKHAVNHPWFTAQLTARRLAMTLTRRFCGSAMLSPVTGEAIFNGHSLMTYWAMHVVRELGDEWHPMVRDTVKPFVFDVGANLGQFGRLALSLNPGAQVIAIDPWKDMEVHNRHTAKFHAVAVGEAPGTVELTRTEGLTASTAPGYYQGACWQVKMVTLDDLWRESGSPEVAVLKIDVDGAEGGVLKGAKNMLAHTQYIIVEVNSAEVLTSLPAEFTWKTYNWHDRIGTRIGVKNHLD